MYSRSRRFVYGEQYSIEQNPVYLMIHQYLFYIFADYGALNYIYLELTRSNL